VADQLPGLTPVEQLVRELSEIADVAEVLRMAIQTGFLVTEDVLFDQLDGVRWSLADYVLCGARTLHLLDETISAAESLDHDHADVALARRALCTRARALSASVRKTNTIVARWLVAHRVAVVNPCYLDSTALFDRLRRGELDPSSISEDPLYLLVCHLQDVLGAAAPWSTDECRPLRHVRAQLTLPLLAVHDEVATAMAHHAAAVCLSRTLDELPAT
jgi:hypothetical protein